MVAWWSSFGASSRSKNSPQCPRVGDDPHAASSNCLPRLQFPSRAAVRSGHHPPAFWSSSLRTQGRTRNQANEISLLFVDEGICMPRRNGCSCLISPRPASATHVLDCSSAWSRGAGCPTCVRRSRSFTSGSSTALPLHLSVIANPKVPLCAGRVAIRIACGEAEAFVA